MNGLDEWIGCMDWMNGLDEWKAGLTMEASGKVTDLSSSSLRQAAEYVPQQSPPGCTHTSPSYSVCYPLCLSLKESNMFRHHTHYAIPYVNP